MELYLLPGLPVNNLMRNSVQAHFDEFHAGTLRIFSVLLCLNTQCNSQLGFELQRVLRNPRIGYSEFPHLRVLRTGTQYYCAGSDVGFNLGKQGLLGNVGLCISLDQFFVYVDSTLFSMRCRKRAEPSEVKKYASTESALWVTPLNSAISVRKRVSLFSSLALTVSSTSMV